MKDLFFVIGVALIAIAASAYWITRDESMSEEIDQSILNEQHNWKVINALNDVQYVAFDPGSQVIVFGQYGVAVPKKMRIWLDIQMYGDTDNWMPAGFVSNGNYRLRIENEVSNVKKTTFRK